MSDKENKSPITVKEEEVDLSKLFSMIGNLFSKLFQNIEKFIKGLFHYLILLLIFLRGHLIKLLLAISIGATIGFIIDYISPVKYTYDMIIQPNYRSIDQIYEKIEYYNVLIEEKDTITLSNEFDISFKIAKNLDRFELIPYETLKDQILAFDEFVKKTDTLTQKHFTFNTFRGKGTSKFDSKLYVYRILSHDGKLKSFAKKIISDIESNPTIRKRREINLRTLKLDSIATEQSLNELKDLRELYKKVTLENLEDTKQAKTGGSTYIDFSKEENLNNDIELFNISRGLIDRLIDIEIKKETTEIVNIITTFNSSGKRLQTIYQTRMFRLGGLFGGIVLSVILLRIFGNYLKKYKLKFSN